MAQNDVQNTSWAWGVAVLIMIMVFAMAFIVLAIEVAAIAFATFAILFVNRRYFCFGVMGGTVSVSLLFPLIGKFLLDANDGFDMFLLVWAYNLLGAGLWSVGFIIACLILDYINDQRNLPTSDADLLAWRIKWGFTKGLNLVDGTTSQLPPTDHPSQAFDVPPQDRL